MASKGTTSANAGGAEKATTDASNGNSNPDPVATETLTANDTPVIQAGFHKGEKLGPVKGRGKQAGPIPADLRADLEASLESNEGVPGGKGDKITRVVNTSQWTTLKNNIKKWKLEKELQGFFVEVPFRTDRDNKPAKDNAAPVDFAVNLTAVSK